MLNEKTGIWIDDTVYTSRPTTPRQEKEMAVYDLLEKLEIPYERVDHDVANTMEACEGIDTILGIEDCKNLFLCNRQKTMFYLLLMPGDKVFKTKDLSEQIQSARLSFADAEYMQEYLNISPGSVSVLGLMNDREHHVQLLIDKDVAEKEYIGCHPCVNTSSLKLKTADLLEKFLPATGHTCRMVEL